MYDYQNISAIYIYIEQEARFVYSFKKTLTFLAREVTRILHTIEWRKESDPHHYKL